MHSPIALGLKENTEEPKWFNTLITAGDGEWLYSGVTHTYASACCNIDWHSCNSCGALPGAYANAGFCNSANCLGSMCVMVWPRFSRVVWMKVLTRGPRTVGGPAVLVLPVISAIFRPEATDVNEQEDETITLDSLFFIGRRLEWVLCYFRW